jgi:hypothetical protein
MALSLLDGDSNGQPFSSKLGGLPLHFVLPSCIQFSDVHVDTHLRESFYPCGRRVRKVARKAGDGPEILGIRRRYAEGTDASIGLSGDMKFIVGDLVLAENLR